MSPASVSEASVLAGSAQTPPLFASVTVTTFAAAAAVALQFEKPVTSTVTGVAGMTKLALKVAVIVSPATSAPATLLRKPTVHVVVAPAVCVAPLNVTLLGVAVIVTAAGATTAVTSLLVAIENVAAAYVPAEGFVTPLTVKVTGEFAPTAHVPPLFASVTVTTLVTEAAVAPQFVNAAPSEIVGVAASVNEGWKVTVIVSPVASAPEALVVNPADHTEADAALVGAAVSVTPETDAAAMAIAAAGDTWLVSALVWTRKPAAG